MPNPMTCDHCAQRITDPTTSVPVPAYAERVCATCADQHHFTCPECRELRRTDDRCSSPNGGPVCYACYDRNYLACYDCSATVERAAAARTVDGNVVCDPCADTRYERCDECIALVREGAVYYVGRDIDGEGGRGLCHGCYNSNYVRCGLCANHRPRGTVQRVQINHEGLRGNACDDCRASRPRCRHCGAYYRGSVCGCRTVRLQSHSFKPPTEFFHTEAEGRQEERAHSRLYLGWELEVEKEDYEGEMSELLQQISAPWLYFKRDGSLSDGGNGGFEIVSHPMTMGWIREQRDEIAARLNTLVRAGCRSYDTSTCGLHVHMSKGAFTPYEFYKFSKLIYENKDFSLKIAQRSGDRVERYSSFHKEDARRMVRKARRMRDNCGTDRYVAVNVENEHTVELRMFKGTLNARSFFKALEFCVGARQFAREESTNHMTSRHFIEWVSANRKAYPNLHEFLVDRHFYDDDESGPEPLPLRRKVPAKH